MNIKELRDDLIIVNNLIKHGRNTGQGQGQWMENLVADQKSIKASIEASMLKRRHYE